MFSIGYNNKFLFSPRFKCTHSSLSISSRPFHSSPSTRMTVEQEHGIPHPDAHKKAFDKHSPKNQSDKRKKCASVFPLAEMALRREKLTHHIETFRRERNSLNYNLH